MAEQARVEAITPDEAASRRSEFVCVDVRGAHEYAGPLGHVEGALSIPLPELEARVGELPRGRALLMICRSGVRSEKACRLLEERGSGPAVNLTGGMIAWNQAGLPVERPRHADRQALLDNALAWLAQVTANPAIAGELAHRDDVARALDWIEERAHAAGTPPDTTLSLAAFRAALASL